MDIRIKIIRQTYLYVELDNESSTLKESKEQIMKNTSIETSNRQVRQDIGFEDKGKIHIKS